MAVPFNYPPESDEERYQRLQQIIADLLTILRVLLASHQRPDASALPAPIPAPRGRLSSCEDEDSDKDDEPQNSPAVPTSAVSSEESQAVECHLNLPDVVPRPAPRLLTRRRDNSYGHLTTTRPRSSFTKYLVDSRPANVATPISSPTTVCYNPPSEDPERLLPWNILLPSAAAAVAPRPAPRRRCRRSSKLRHDQQDVEVLKPDSDRDVQWVMIGKELRNIADHFSETLEHSPLELDGPDAAVSSSSTTSKLFSYFVPKTVPGTIWTTVVLLVGWKIKSLIKSGR